MTEIPASHLIPAVHIETLEEVLLWDGQGRVANRHGDLYGTSPNRLIRTGRAIIDLDRLEAAQAVGWRVVPKEWPNAPLTDGLIGAGQCDPDFAWIERTIAERPAE